MTVISHFLYGRPLAARVCACARLHPRGPAHPGLQQLSPGQSHSDSSSCRGKQEHGPLPLG